MIFNDFTSVLLYFAVFALSIFFLYFGQKKKLKSFTIIGLLIVVLFSALRLDCGTDTATYRTFYNQVSDSSISRSLVRFTSGEMEPFIILVAMLGGKLHLNAQFMFTVFAFITVLFLYKTTKKLGKKYFWYIRIVFTLCAKWQQ